MATLFKYILQSVDLQSEQPWENKVLYIFYLDLMTGLFASWHQSGSGFLHYDIRRMGKRERERRVDREGGKEREEMMEN